VVKRWRCPLSVLLLDEAAVFDNAEVMQTIRG